MRDLLLALALAIHPPAEPTIAECRAALAHPRISREALLNRCQWQAERCYVESIGCDAEDTRRD